MIKRVDSILVEDANSVIYHILLYILILKQSIMELRLKVLFEAKIIITKEEGDQKM